MFECKECVVKFLRLQSNQLVFSYNPNFPSVTENKLPALEGVTSSELVASHLNAWHSARRRFIETEADEKLRRALKHKKEHQQAWNIRQEIKCITSKKFQVIGKALGQLLDMITNKFLLDIEQHIFE